MKLAIGLCVAIVLLAVIFWPRDDVARNAQRIFDDAFASKISAQNSNPTLRVRTGPDIFCIQEDINAEYTASQLISDLSDTFSLGWRQISVKRLEDCPKRGPTFYILRDARPNQSELLDLIEGIAGSLPSNPDIYFPEWALGFSVDLPGFVNRQFVFATNSDDVPVEVARSILSEELLHSILRASDVESTEILSLLGEDARDTDYSQWFHNNPIGFCTIDIILMELLMGSSTSGLYKMKQLREHLVSNFDDVFTAASTHAPALAKYSDPRCWAW